MVIGYDAKRAFNNTTGLGNYSRMLICGLASEYNDFHAMLYAPQMSGYYKSFFSCYANVSSRQPTGFDRHVPALWRGFGVTIHLKGDNVELYHGLSHELPHRIPSSVKKVVTMHDLIAWRYPHYFKPLDAWIHRLKQKHSCMIADVVVAISEQTKRDLVEIMHVPEEKIRVLYQSCDPIFWDSVTPEAVSEARENYNLPERYFITVGTIEERKNQVSIVKALSQLPDDYHLVVVGRKRGHYGANFESLVSQLGMASRVHVISNADFEDFPALYAGSVASVYMSVFEGFGIPILESMCARTPVVSSNTSSMPEVGGDAVLYADPENVDEIAAAMRRLADNEALREELRGKGDVQKMKFSKKVIVDGFYSLYAELLGHSESVC